MISSNPFILYSLPKTRTTQQLHGGRKIEKSWENVCTFLNKCTTITPDEPSSISLTAYSAYTGDQNPEIAERIIQNAKIIFGNGRTDPIAYSYPSGIPDKHTKTEWQLDKSDLKKAVEYLINGQPWAKFTFGPIELVISYNFKLKDPSTNRLLPDQNLSSGILIWLSRSCICSPDLYFPYRQANKEFYNYLQIIDCFLPFKLETKFLRLGRPNKNKTNYIFTKLQDK